MTRRNSSDFDRLRKFTEHGWFKLNTRWIAHVGRRTPHYYDLYWAVRALDKRLPVQPNLDPIFLNSLTQSPSFIKSECGSPRLTTSTRRERRKIEQSGNMRMLKSCVSSYKLHLDFVQADGGSYGIFFPVSKQGLTS